MRLYVCLWLCICVAMCISVHLSVYECMCVDGPVSVYVFLCLSMRLSVDESLCFSFSNSLPHILSFHLSSFSPSFSPPPRRPSYPSLFIFSLAVARRAPTDSHTHATPSKWVGVRAALFSSPLILLDVLGKCSAMVGIVLRTYAAPLHLHDCHTD